MMKFTLRESISVKFTLMLITHCVFAGSISVEAGQKSNPTVCGSGDKSAGCPWTDRRTDRRGPQCRLVHRPSETRGGGGRAVGEVQQDGGRMEGRIEGGQI